MRNSDTLEQLATEINGAEIFGLDKDKCPSRYRVLAYELIEDIYNYLVKLSKSRYEDMGLEIIETVNDCLGSFDKSKGDFMNYFMSSMKRRVEREEWDRNDRDKRGGIALPEQQRRTLQQIYRIANTMRKDPDDVEVLSTASNLLGVPLENLRDLMLLDANTTVIHDTQRDKNDDIPGIFDALQAADSTEDDVAKQIEIEQFLSQLEAEFVKCRSSQQQVISKILTAKLLACPPDILSAAASASFFDLDMYKRFLADGFVPTAREIAGSLGKNEASISRTVATFIKKIKPLSEKNNNR